MQLCAVSCLLVVVDLGWMCAGVLDWGLLTPVCFLQALTRLEQLELDGTSVCLQEKMRALRKPMEWQPWQVEGEDSDDLVF
jgi:hypothetical protein